MSLLNKILIGFCLLTFVLGMLLDRFFIDFPYLQLDPKIGILNVFNLLVTISIAFMIPLCISKLMEDQRGVKNFFIDEIKELIDIVVEIKNIIEKAHEVGVFVSADRNRIIFLFHKAEVKIGSIIQQINEAYKNKAKIAGEILTTLLLTYKGYVTGGDLMLSSFEKVDESFYKESITKYSIFETGLKIFIQKVFKF